MRPVMQFQQSSLSFTLIALDNTKISLKKAGKAAVEAAGDVLYKRVKKEIGLRDHSLTDLADRDNPYARRHGSIQIHTKTPWQVHRKPSPLNKTHRNQTDWMWKATYKESFTQLSTKNPGVEVGFDTSLAPEAIEVTQGTSVMLPRDPLWITAHLPDVQKEMMANIVRRLGRDLRTKMGVRFGAGAPTITTGRKGAATGIR